MSVWGVSAQWNPLENTRVTVDSILDFEAQINKDGVTFVGFWDMVPEDPEKQGDRYSDDSDVAYYLQIIDKDGNKLFPDEGRLISHEPTRSFTYGLDNAIFTDSDGNALYIVKDERNWNNSSYPNQSYFVYKVSPSGEFLWEEPLDLDHGDAYYLVANIKVIEIADGSYIFAHDRYPEENLPAYIAIDRVSKNGEFVWDEPLLWTDNVFSYSFPFLVDAGSGNFILVYSRNGVLTAQKFFDKDNLWSSPAVIYKSGYTTGQTPNTAVTVIPDQKGGCIVAWYDDRYNSAYEKAYVSHILSNGTQEFITSGNEEGLQLSWNPYTRAFRPRLCYDPAGEILYAAWSESNSNQSFRSIVLQKITKQGELQWTNTTIVDDEDNTNGLVLDFGWNPEAVDYYSVQLAGKGKIAVFHQHDYNVGNSTENIVTLLDVSGDQPEKLNEGLIFAEKGKAKAGLVSLPLFDNDYFLTFWDDYRNSTFTGGSAVFAHKISLANDLGVTAIRFTETASGNRFAVVSNSAGGSVHFVLDSPAAGSATLEVYSVSGQKVARIPSKLHTGENIIPWNVQRLPAGIYVAQLVTQNGVQAKRFIVK
jgi:hypothetical protein